MCVSKTQDAGLVGGCGIFSFTLRKASAFVSFCIVFWLAWLFKTTWTKADGAELGLNVSHTSDVTGQNRRRTSGKTSFRERITLYRLYKFHRNHTEIKELYDFLETKHFEKVAVPGSMSLCGGNP